MQWNLLVRCAESEPAGRPARPGWVYFVHSYAAERDDHTVATCDYGGPVVAAVERGALWATQFHPEKSGAHRARASCATSSAAPRPPAEAA